jgi:hypothetical protein
MFAFGKFEQPQPFQSLRKRFLAEPKPILFKLTSDLSKPLLAGIPLREWFDGIAEVLRSKCTGSEIACQERLIIRFEDGLQIFGWAKTRSTQNASRQDWLLGMRDGRVRHEVNNADELPAAARCRRDAFTAERAAVCKSRQRRAAPPGINAPRDIVNHGQDNEEAQQIEKSSARGRGPCHGMARSAGLSVPKEGPPVDDLFAPFAGSADTRSFKS